MFTMCQSALTTLMGSCHALEIQKKNCFSIRWWCSNFQLLLGLKNFGFYHAHYSCALKF